jgi:hypothetical protein
MLNKILGWRNNLICFVLFRTKQQKTKYSLMITHPTAFDKLLFLSAWLTRCLYCLLVYIVSWREEAQVFCWACHNHVWCMCSCKRVWCVSWTGPVTGVKSLRTPIFIMVCGEEKEGTKHLYSHLFICYFYINLHLTFYIFYLQASNISSWRGKVDKGPHLAKLYNTAINNTSRICHLLGWCRCEGCTVLAAAFV